MVGRVGAGSGAAGIALGQDVAFPPIERTYRLSVDWSVQCLVNVYNQTGGVFELEFNGAVVAQVTAPATVQGQSSYGRLEAEVSSASLGVHPIAVRILRPTVLGEEVFQYIDNVALTLISCYTNCDGSTGSPRLTANDLQCFLNKFAAGDSYANCDGSNAPPQLNANDFLCFLQKYAVGCS